MTKNTFDLIVIGGGPAGYVSAIRASQLGQKVACVDRRTAFGGTCLNVGCIPSKALLHSSHRFWEVRHELKDHGINGEGVSLDLATLMKRKNKVVSELTKGIDYLFKKNNVTAFHGSATFEKADTLKVTLEDGSTETLSAPHIVIATGSKSAELPGVEVDEKRIVTSTGALAFEKVPKRLVVIGGGYIGLEMASVWNRLGSEVSVVEFLDKIVPVMDEEVGQALQKSLTKQGFKFHLGMKVKEVVSGKSELMLNLESVKDKKTSELACDAVLVSIGRVPYTQGLGLEAIGVDLTDRGFIDVDKNFQTSVPGVYAIGDVIPGPMLAHKGEEEGVAVAEILAGQKGHVNYDTIPGVVYTHPEAASVGKTEQELKTEGVDYITGKFPFMANSRAKANGDTEGFVKILSDKASDRVLGVHIMGPEAGTMIAEAVLAMEYAASSEDIARTCHAHPTLNEAIKEAALAVAGRAIHM